MRILATAVLVPAMLAGCAHPWQTARTVVVQGAEAVASANTAVAAEYQRSGCAATQDVAELEHCVEQLQAATEALVIARDALLQGEAIVDTWQRAQEEPAEWRGWLSSAALAVARLPALLEAAGVPIPREVLDWTAVADGFLEGYAP